MDRLLHSRCNVEVEFGDKVTEGYLCFCPECEEDLDYHETSLNGVNSLTIKQMANELGITVVKLECGCYCPVHNRVLSTLNFANPVSAYEYGLSHLGEE